MGCFRSFLVIFSGRPRRPLNITRSIRKILSQKKPFGTVSLWNCWELLEGFDGDARLGNHQADEVIFGVSCRFQTAPAVEILATQRLTPGFSLGKSCQGGFDLRAQLSGEFGAEGHGVIGDV